MAKAREIGALSKLCFDFLPPGQARLIRAVNLRDRQLILLAASPAAAAKLKLLSEALCKYLSEQRAQVNSVLVRVQPDRAQPSGQADAKPRRHPTLSASALKDLQALYRKLPDSKARRALKTLLDHHLK